MRADKRADARVNARVDARGDARVDTRADTRADASGPAVAKGSASTGRGRGRFPVRLAQGLVVVLGLAALVALLRVIAGPSPGSDPLAAQAAGSSLPGATSAGGAGLGVTGPGPMVSPAAEARAARELEAAQRAAQEAAVRAAGTATGPRSPAALERVAPGTPAAPLLTRPDYVSEVEWQVLQGIAARSIDPPRELSRLVDKLRFSKQLDAWRTTADVAQQQVLAAQLLQDLPARVQAGDYSRADALALQQQLLATLEPDAAARAARAEAEAARLGGRLLQEQRR